MGTEPSGPIAVWIVDDQELYRHLVALNIEHAGGFEVLGSSDSPEPLLAHLAAGLRPPDVVVADLHMPGGDLSSIARRLPEHGPRVLHLSAAAGAGSAAAVLRDGAWGLIPKPVNGRLLVSAVRCVAAGAHVFGAIDPRDVDHEDGRRETPPPTPPIAAQALATARPAGGAADLPAALLDELRAADDLAQLLVHLAYGVAHDSNNLLAGIRGHAQLAKEGIAGGRTQHAADDLDHMGRGADRLSDVLRRLMPFVLPARHRARWSVGGDLGRAAEDGARHHQGLPGPEVRQRSAAPLPVEMDGGRAGNLVWAAVRAVAAAAPGQPLAVEARAVPSARSLPDDVRFGRIRVSAPLADGAAGDTPQFPLWGPPFVGSQLEPGDAAVVMAGARGAELVVDVWMPLVEP